MQWGEEWEKGEGEEDVAVDAGARGTGYGIYRVTMTKIYVGCIVS